MPLGYTCSEPAKAFPGQTSHSGKGKLKQKAHVLAVLNRKRAKPPAEISRPSNTSAIGPPLAPSLSPAGTPGLFNYGRICWLRCAPQQYTLQGSTTPSYASPLATLATFA
jgi:hypothetical protein